MINFQGFEDMDNISLNDTLSFYFGVDDLDNNVLIIDLKKKVFNTSKIRHLELLQKYIDNYRTY